MNFYEKIADVQARLKAPKSQYNSFGKYAYRNLEDILEAVKPLLKEHGLILHIQDFIEPMGDRFYIKSEAVITDGENRLVNCAYAREPLSRKGMDDSQITGATSSYARKYCLNGLFLIDDTKDADSDPVSEKIVNCRTLDELKTVFTGLSKEEQQRYNEIKNKRKGELS